MKHKFKDNRESTYKDLLVSLILNAPRYNGHYQLELPYSPSVETAKQLCILLDEALGEGYNGEWTGSCEARYDSDGNGGIYAVDYWKEGENITGAKDMLVLGWDVGI